MFSSILLIMVQRVSVSIGHRIRLQYIFLHPGLVAFPHSTVCPTCNRLFKYRSALFSSLQNN